MGFVDTSGPMSVLAVCAALSLVSLAAMLVLERALRAQEPGGGAPPGKPRRSARR
jgi:hypothetical protein